MTEARRQTLLWLAQRASAAVLAVCVTAHLATIFYVAREHLGAAEILDRTRGSWMLAMFYAVFVVAAAVHAPLGVRAICEEWLGWRGRPLDRATLVAAALLLAPGLGAVWAVFA